MYCRCDGSEPSSVRRRRKRKMAKKMRAHTTAPPPSEEEEEVEAQGGRAERGAQRSIAGPVQNVVGLPVMAEPGFEHRPCVEQEERNPRQQDTREERVRDLETEGADLPRGHDPEGAL